MGNFNLSDYEAGRETPEEKRKWQEEARWLRQTEVNDNHSGYIPFPKVVSRVGKSERQVRYDVATSGYAYLVFGKRLENGQIVYPEKLVELTAKTGIYVGYADGNLFIKASAEARLMQVSKKTVENDIKAALVSGWLSGCYYVDFRNGLEQASLHKSEDSTSLYQDTLELSQEIRCLMAGSY